MEYNKYDVTISETRSSKHKHNDAYSPPPPPHPFSDTNKLELTNEKYKVVVSLHVYVIKLFFWFDVIISVLYK